MTRYLARGAVCEDTLSGRCLQTLCVATHDPEVGDVAGCKIILDHGRLAGDIDQSATFGEALKLKTGR